jgi:hypothetical protein
MMRSENPSVIKRWLTNPIILLLLIFLGKVVLDEFFRSGRILSSQEIVGLINQFFNIIILIAFTLLLLAPLIVFVVWLANFVRGRYKQIPENLRYYGQPSQQDDAREEIIKAYEKRLGGSRLVLRYKKDFLGELKHIQIEGEDIIKCEYYVKFKGLFTFGGYLILTESRLALIGSDTLGLKSAPSTTKDAFDAFVLELEEIKDVKKEGNYLKGIYLWIDTNNYGEFCLKVKKPYEWVEAIKQQIGH